MFKNLQAEMARIGIGLKELAEATNRSYDTMRGKMNGRSEFTLLEMDTIQEKFFPSLNISYLFKKFKEE